MYRIRVPSALMGLLFVAAVAAGPAFAGVRNVILFIGDGMGPQQVGLLLQHARIMGRTTNLERYMGRGRSAIVLTHPHGHLVTDSAAAATSIACGYKTLPGMLGLNAKGRKVPSILELARGAGKSTGLVTTTKVTDATPAGFSAHVLKRSRQDRIAEQQLRRSRPDVLLGGGMSYWMPRGRSVKEYGGAHYFKGGYDRSQRRDDVDLVAEARSLGYGVCYDKQGLVAAARGKKILGLFAARNLPFAIDRMNSPTIPSLSDMTRAAITVLDRNPKGFFLMVEGASIDLMSHNNDIGACLAELLEFDRALGLALPLVTRGDTLVLITADHSTGGLGLHYNSFRKPRAVKLESGKVWKHWTDFVPDGRLLRIARQKTTLRAVFERSKNVEDLMRSVEANTQFKLTRKQAQRLWAASKERSYRPDDPESPFYPHDIGRNSTLLARELSGQMGAAWGSGTHDCTPVLLVGVGKGAGRVQGVLDNTDIFRIMRVAFGFDS